MLNGPIFDGGKKNFNEFILFRQHNLSPDDIQEFDFLHEKLCRLCKNVLLKITCEAWVPLIMSIEGATKNTDLPEGEEISQLSHFFIPIPAAEQKREESKMLLSMLKQERAALLFCEKRCNSLEEEIKALKQQKEDIKKTLAVGKMKHNFLMSVRYAMENKINQLESCLNSEDAPISESETDRIKARRA